MNTVLPLNVIIQPCTSLQFEEIKKYISLFELDSRQLSAEQFLVAVKNNRLIGFGRIREYENCSELCSLGVIEPERNKGVGKALTQELIKKARKKLFLVCIIPEYFEKLGFEITYNYPNPIADKLNYCRNSLPVEENYVAMELIKEF